MKAPIISVVIPTHNRLNKLLATLDSLMRQEIEHSDYEIVIVDDGSTPGIMLPDKYNSSFINVIRTEGIERSLARNTGAKATSGDLLVFVDDDLIVRSDFLSCHIRAQEEWEGALVIGAVKLPQDMLDNPFVRFRQDLEEHSIPQKRGITTLRNFCTAQNMSVPKELFLMLDGFEDYMVSSEDQDLALRHTAVGGRIAFIPEAEAIHCDDALDIRTYCRRSEWGMREMIPFCRRYPDWPDNVARARVNGPIQFGREPFLLSLRKMFKLIVGVLPVTWLLFLLVGLVERVAPQSGILDRLYRLLLGIFIFRGYRGGLKKYGTARFAEQDLDARLDAERTAL